MCQVGKILHKYKSKVIHISLDGSAVFALASQLLATEQRQTDRPFTYQLSLMMQLNISNKLRIELNDVCNT